MEQGMSVFVEKKPNSKIQNQNHNPVVIQGNGLTVEEVVRVSQKMAEVQITKDSNVLNKVDTAYRMMQDAANAGAVIYGVTTGFGGMADVIISMDEIGKVQQNMLWIHKAGAGKFLPVSDVRAAMLLRANSHLRGASGIRLELIERLQIFLNAGVTPCVPELGSIGASGDLVPLSYITGAIIGHEAGYQVHYKDSIIPAREALKTLELPPLKLQPKEALAMLNGTSVMTGIAANCLEEASELFSLALYVHALFIQGLNGTDLSFEEFIHQNKPHTGQVWVADQMRRLIEGSALIRHGKGGQERNPKTGLVQDRYSLRCLPQYLGPVFEGLWKIQSQIEVEMNSTNDNPLIDVDTGGIYYGGNFLGEYVGVGMDQLRMYLGLVAKHLDTQIALLVEPKFSNGLAPCLVGNQDRTMNMGMKGLQIVANSIMPLISFYGNSLADRFPTHAEQFNQNINSQGFGSANLTRQSLDLFRQYVSISLLFAVQAIDLRAQKMFGHYDGSQFVSPSTRPLYEAVRELTDRPSQTARPWLWNDDEQHLDEQTARLVEDLAGRDSMLKARAQFS